MKPKTAEKNPSILCTVGMNYDKMVELSEKEEEVVHK